MRSMKKELLIDFKNKIFVGSAGRKSLWDVSIPAKAKAVIVFIHGYKGYKDWGAWPLMEDYFLDKGYGFVKFNFSHNGGTVDDPIDFPDLQAFGENTYSYEVNELNQVVLDVHRLITQECELNAPIYLLGHSRGGGIGTLVAAKNEYVKKLVSLAGISDIAMRFPSGEELLEWERDGILYVQNGRTQQEMPHFFTFYQDFLKHKDELHIQSAAESLQIPFLQVHGDMDLAVSITEGQHMAAWTDTNICIIKGAGHTFGAKQPWTASHLPADFELALKEILLFLKKE